MSKSAGTTNKRKRKRAGAKREKDNVLIIKPDESKYSDVLKATRSNVELADLEADVHSIRIEK